MAFRTGLRPTRFAVNITENPPIKVADLFEKTYTEMDIEEMLEEKFKELKNPATTQNKNIHNPAKPKG